MEKIFYQPQFSISSKKTPFSIRIEIKLDEKVDGLILNEAVNKSIKRYPYFSGRIKKNEEEYFIEENTLPILVYEGKKTRNLGTKSVNYHFTSVSYFDSQINFFITHVITDGGGFFPFVKTVLFYYLSVKKGKSFLSDGFNLLETPFYTDEIYLPFKEDILENAKPFTKERKRDAFKLYDGGFIRANEKGRIFRFKIPLKDTMDFSFDNDGSPNALLSSLMAKAIWSVHPNIKKEIVSAVSFNMRPYIKSFHNFRLLSSRLKISYPERLKNENILKLCTCTRGQVSLYSQTENVLFELKRRKNLFNDISSLSLKEKNKFLRNIASFDANDNTFSISYVGKIDYGEISPYIKADYNITDGLTSKSIFIEIGATKDYFSIAFIQGFKSNVYYKAFLSEIEKCGIKVYFDSESKLNIPKLKL